MDGELQFEAAVSSTVGLLKAPINDLSRGYNALEVYSMAIITVVLLGWALYNQKNTHESRHLNITVKALYKKKLVKHRESFK